MADVAAPPFARRPNDLGRLDDGRALGLVPITGDVARYLGTAMEAIDPWRHYGTTAETIARSLATTLDGGVRYAAEVDGTPVGAIAIRSPWLVGPYLQLLAVLPSSQGQGIGDRLLSWFEAVARTDGARQAWLCVTASNDRARAFYRTRGWQDEARLAHLVADREDEILMRKRLLASPG